MRSGSRMLESGTSGSTRVQGSIEQGQHIVTPHGKPVENSEHKPYPKLKRPRSTHPEPSAQSVPKGESTPPAP